MEKFLVYLLKFVAFFLLIVSLILLIYSLYSPDVSKVFGVFIFGGCVIVSLILYSLGVLLHRPEVK